VSLLEQEGFVPVDGFRVWYRSIGGGGDQDRIPLLILHGGPGAPHDYLENLEALASQTQKVIFMTNWAAVVLTIQMILHSVRSRDLQMK
jgi:pimeloyl-ACP methyl ester carboxylesterase